MLKRVLYSFIDFLLGVRNPCHGGEYVITCALVQAPLVGHKDLVLYLLYVRVDKILFEVGILSINNQLLVISSPNNIFFRNHFVYDNVEHILIDGHRLTVSYHSFGKHRLLMLSELYHHAKAHNRGYLK
jgi:hypothetical protein